MVTMHGNRKTKRRSNRFLEPGTYLEHELSFLLLALFLVIMNTNNEMTEVISSENTAFRPVLLSTSKERVFRCLTRQVNS